MDKSNNPVISITQTVAGACTFQSFTTPNYWERKNKGLHLYTQRHFAERKDAWSSVVSGKSELGMYGLESASVLASGGASRNGTKPIKMNEMGRAEDQVNNGLLQKAKATDIDLGIILGELKATVSTVTTCIQGVVQLYTALKDALKLRGLPKPSSFITPQQYVERYGMTEGSKSAKEIAGLFLGYEYGIKPLVRDSYKAVGLMDTGLSRIVNTPVEIRMGASFSLNGKDRRTISNQVYVETQCGGGGSVKGKIFCKVNGVTANGLALVGLSDPISVIWELVPFSFVVDWFLPIGDYLQSLTNPTGLTPFDGWIMRKANVTVNRSERSGPSAAIRKSVHRTYYKHRTAITSWPKFHFQQPDFGLTQLTNGMALMIKAFA